MKHAVFVLSVAMLAAMLASCGDPGAAPVTTGPPGPTAIDTSLATSSTAGDTTTSSPGDAASNSGSFAWPMAAPTVIDVATKEVARVTVSPAGALIGYGSLTLSIPAGAVAADTEIVVTRLTEPYHTEPAENPDPQGASAMPVGPAFDFGPAGVTFTEPVTITLPYDPGMGPDGRDPRQIAVAYWNGESWILAGGTVHPEDHTVDVQLPEFSGSMLTTVALAAAAGIVINRVITWAYSDGESVKTDPVFEGKAKDYVRPNDPTIVKWAGRAMLENPETGEMKSLDDPDLPSWIASAAENKQKPALVYKVSENVIFRTQFSSQDGSNWQTPDHYFGNGTWDLGPASGDCTDQTNIGVSIWKNRRFKAKAVYCYAGGDKNLPHVYGEVLIGDKVYRIDDSGALITEKSDPYNFGTYQPITDPNDPHYNCMWDDEGQEPYDESWTKPGAFEDFTGTYKGTLPGGDPWGDIPYEFTVSETGAVEGGFDFVKTFGSSTVTLTGSLRGSVSKDGALEARGLSEGTASNNAGSNTTTAGIVLEGTISDGVFTGTLTGEKGSEPVTARRQ